MLSVIIVTYKCARKAAACIESVRSQQEKLAQIIVIDNGSRDSAAAMIRERYPEVFVIENDSNRGACAARNQGIAVSRGEWVLILDCDTVLGDGFIKAGLDFIEGLPKDAGFVQPLILERDGRSVYSAGIIVSNPLKRFYDAGKGSPASAPVPASGRIIGACAAAAFLRRSMLEEIREDTGYFDERFFFLVEDVDLACRAQQRGWKAFYCPAAVCFHEGGSSGFEPRLRQYLCWRNRKMLLEKMNSSVAARLVRLACYDLPRTCALVASNPYVRNRMICKREPLSVL